MTALRYPGLEQETASQDWSCGRCGRSGTAPAEAAVIFHHCPLPKRRRVVRMPEVRHVTREEARGAVWSGLAEAMDRRDADWLLRR